MRGGTIVLSPPVRLAHQAAESAIKNEVMLGVPTSLSPELVRQRACYVLVFENPGRRLRTLYGHVLPTTPCLGAEIIANTTKAVQGLFRRADLPQLSFEVAVVGQLQRISDPLHLNPEQYGLYIRSEMGRIAVVLPKRPGIETGSDQIATALREGDIDVRKESITLYRFPVHFHES
jgi:AMMECR1 domain-containing protein